MSITYACFLSYRHVASPEANKIIASLYRVLRGQVKIWDADTDVYCDIGSGQNHHDGLNPGDLFNQVLASKLFQSACMVMIYNPSYFSLTHPYCACEYKMMVKLERARLRDAPAEFQAKGLIIPIVLRGESKLPSEIKDHRQYISLEDELLAASDFKRRAVLSKIRQVADIVIDRYDTLCQLGFHTASGPNGAAFPSLHEISPWLQQITSGQRPQRLPGRAP